VRKLEHKPVLRRDLHPVAEQRNHLSGGEQAVVAYVHRAKYVVEPFLHRVVRLLGG
jgi:hypothetical protein